MKSHAEQCELASIRGVLLRLLAWFEASLRHRLELIGEELSPREHISPRIQADLLDQVLARLVRGIELVWLGDCADMQLAEVLDRLYRFQRDLNFDVDEKVRKADPASDWCKTSMQLIGDAIEEIGRLRTDVKKLGINCRRYLDAEKGVVT